MGTDKVCSDPETNHQDGPQHPDTASWHPRTFSRRTSLAATPAKDPHRHHRSRSTSSSHCPTTSRAKAPNPSGTAQQVSLNLFGFVFHVPSSAGRGHPAAWLSGLTGPGAQCAWGAHWLEPTTQALLFAQPRLPPRLNWWSWTGSNRRPHACKARALPTELQPRNSSPTLPGRMRATGFAYLSAGSLRLTVPRCTQGPQAWARAGQARKPSGRMAAPGA